MIKYIQHIEIDFNKWDKCISASYNGNVTAFSWFLNIVSPEWEALIENDYERVMPLTGKLRFRIPFLMQPQYSQQLGIFSIKELTKDKTVSFLKQIPSKYLYTAISLNCFNNYDDVFQNTDFKITHQLDLIVPYSRSIRNYKKAALTKIKTARDDSVTYLSGLQPKVFLTFAFNHGFVKTEKEIVLLKMLLSLSILKNVGEIIGAYDKDKQLCAAVFLAGSHQKTDLLSAISQGKGQETPALYGIIDNYIRINSEKNITLDFGGLQKYFTDNICLNFGARESHFQKYKRLNAVFF